MKMNFQFNSKSADFELKENVALIRRDENIASMAMHQLDTLDLHRYLSFPRDDFYEASIPSQGVSTINSKDFDFQIWRRLK